jgi:hypothetical protein
VLFLQPSFSLAKLGEADAAAYDAPRGLRRAHRASHGLRRAGRIVRIRSRRSTDPYAKCGIFRSIARSAMRMQRSTRIRKRTCVGKSRLRVLTRKDAHVFTAVTTLARGTATERIVVDATNANTRSRRTATRAGTNANTEDASHNPHRHSERNKDRSAPEKREQQCEAECEQKYCDRQREHERQQRNECTLDRACVRSRTPRWLHAESARGIATDGEDAKSTRESIWESTRKAARPTA